MRLRVGIPLKLLLASAPLLLIPWLGLRYVRELERFLLQGQEQGLVATARAVATALNDRPDVLLSGEVYAVPVDPRRDLRVANLTDDITLDGASADWDRQALEPHPYESGPSQSVQTPFSFRYRIGRHEKNVYLLFEVQDAHVVPADLLTDVTACDHAEIAVVTADDEFLRFVVNAPADGPVSTFLISPQGESSPDSRIRGVWRTTPESYAIELRLPRSLIGPRLAFAVEDVDDLATRTTVAVLRTAGTGDPSLLGTVLIPSPRIAELIRGLERAHSRIWVLDVNGRVLAHAGSLKRPAEARDEKAAGIEAWFAAAARPLLRRWLTMPTNDFADAVPGTYRLDSSDVRAALKGEPATRWRLTADSRAAVLSAAHPVYVDKRVSGAVLVEETTNDVLAVRNRVFERLLVAILAVYFAGACGLLLFASRLSYRVRRLRDEVEQAIDPHGRVRGTSGGVRAADELGDLSRSIVSILERLQQYTGYLEQIAKRLSHEIRTPVSVVRSSLDNLRLQPLAPEARVYIDRADEGLRRLITVLGRMAEATRLEGTLAQSEREAYELGPVVRGCVQGYRLAHPEREIVLREGEEPIRVLGAPDLLAQLLDKLVDNALEFATAGTPIEVELTRTMHHATLRILNAGPLLPEEMRGRLFESMVSVRTESARGREPHLGLGLYVVRLIAEFHRGTVSADNRDDIPGVAVALRLPLGPDAPAAPPPRSSAS